MIVNQKNILVLVEELSVTRYHLKNGMKILLIKLREDSTQWNQLNS